MLPRTRPGLVLVPAMVEGLAAALRAEGERPAGGETRVAWLTRRHFTAAERKGVAARYVYEEHDGALPTTLTNVAHAPVALHRAARYSPQMVAGLNGARAGGYVFRAVGAARNQTQAYALVGRAVAEAAAAAVLRRAALLAALPHQGRISCGVLCAGLDGFYAGALQVFGDRVDFTLAVDMDARVVQLLRKLHPGATVIEGDVREVGWDGLSWPRILSATSPCGLFSKKRHEGSLTGAALEAAYEAQVQIHESMVAFVARAGRLADKPWLILVENVTGLPERHPRIYTRVVTLWTEGLPEYDMREQIVCSARHGAAATARARWMLLAVRRDLALA